MIKVAATLIAYFAFNIALAGVPVRVEGKVTKIEDGDAIIAAKDGTIRIPLSKLSKASQKKVRTSVGKSAIVLKVPVEVLQRY